MIAQMEQGITFMCPGIRMAYLPEFKKGLPIIKGAWGRIASPRCGVPVVDVVVLPLFRVRVRQRDGRVLHDASTRRRICGLTLGLYATTRRYLRVAVSTVTAATGKRRLAGITVTAAGRATTGRRRGSGLLGRKVTFVWAILGGTAQLPAVRTPRKGLRFTPVQQDREGAFVEWRW